MSEIEISTTQQSEVLENHAAETVADEAQPTAAAQEATYPLEEPTATTSTEETVETEEKCAISPAKLAANRANAQRSTGPTTPEGKEKSKFNAVKHGLTARYFPAVIQAGTPEWEEFEAVRTDLFDYYQPVDPLERFHFERIILEFMRYHRFVEREKQFCDRYRGFNPEILDKATRYQTAINRQLLEAMKELERLQAKRKAEEEKKVETDGSSD